MAFQDERRRLSWSLTVLFSLAIAGCGGKSASSDPAATSNSQSRVATQGEQTANPAPFDSETSGKVIRYPESPVSPATPGDQGSEPQVAQPGTVIENPIFADPIATPVPDDAQPNTTPKDDGVATADDSPATGDEPRTGRSEPEPEQPEVATRPTLRWNSPMTRVDGSKLYPGEISGYRIYFRLRHQSEFQSLVVEGPDADALVLDNFASGAYEFAVSTLDTEGLESRRSEPVSVDLI